MTLPGHEPALPVRRTAKGTILVVEDDASLRHVVERQLTRAGHAVHDCGGFTQAIELAAKLPTIDLLPTDPEGAELLRRTRPDLPIVFMSGYAQQEERLQGLGPLLMKPFTREALLDAIEGALGSRQSTVDS